MPWYALHSKPNKELSLCEQLDARSIEVFYPQLHLKPVNPRARKTRPYFPGYLFVHVDLGQASTIAFRWIPYSYGLVAFCGEPAPVPDECICAIQRHLADLESAGQGGLPDLKAGDRLAIIDGALAGYEAILDRCLSGRQRVRVLLSMIGQRQVAVELHATQVEKARA